MNRYDLIGAKAVLVRFPVRVHGSVHERAYRHPDRGNEFLIRVTTAEAIRDGGFEVIEAANADTAIVILESRRDIQVVFTEIELPGAIGGAELAHLIKNRWPRVRVIATSGCVPFMLDLPAGTVLFPKPYSLDQIAWTLRALTGC